MPLKKDCGKNTDRLFIFLTVPGEGAAVMQQRAVFRGWGPNIRSYATTIIGTIRSRIFTDPSQRPSLAEPKILGQQFIVFLTHVNKLGRIFISTTQVVHTHQAHFLLANETDPARLKIYR